MFRIKKIDLYILTNFLGVFLMTFVICVFILLMQLLWMYVNDLVGKGVEMIVLAEFFLYASISVVPLALPLSILLASLMTFGNMGEKFELTAMKAAGISLFRIMRPLTLLILFVCTSAFFFSNYIVPVAETKMYTLLFSLKQKSPELDIPTGEFYDGIKGYNLYVRGKDPERKLLENVMIYDFSSGFDNATVMVADSGRLFLSADKKYLLLDLYSGASFENLKKQRVSSTENVPYRREEFEQKKILIDFNSDFNRLDESILKDQHVSKNVVQLVESIDSVSLIASNRAADQSATIVSSRYFGRDHVKDRVLVPVEESKADSLHIDSLYNTLDDKKKLLALKHAVTKAKSMQDQVVYNKIMLNDSQMYIRRHQAQFHRKFTLSFACLIFFFIGAPLGAIIRKGGLGAPVVISVIMFIFYFIIDNTGFKMAREGIWEAHEGMWLSSAVLLPIGVFLTYKAATDAALLNPDAWGKAFRNTLKLLLKLKNRVVQLFRNNKPLSETETYKTK